jgi:hypothetical protein
MGTEAKPYDRVHFVLLVFKSPRSGTANLFTNGCNELAIYIHRDDKSGTFPQL